MTALDVACATDARYLPHAATMVHSLLVTHPDRDLRIHVLVAPDVAERDIERLVGMAAGTTASVSTLPVAAEALAGLPSWGRIPATMWSRILLPDLLPGTERALYVDVDVLVVDALDALWTIDLEGSSVAAVTNVPERHRLGHAAALGLPGPRSYFNSGVLLLDLEAMRAAQTAEAIRDVVRVRGDELLWPDQDALNLVLGTRRIALHPRWNLMNSVRTFPWSAELLDPRAIAEAIAAPAIVHFEGPAENKPWHVLCDHPQREAWRRHRADTPWPRMRPDGLTPGNLLRLAARRRSAAATIRP